MEAKLNYEKYFERFSENPEQIILQQMWKILNKIWPKIEVKVPSAKKNHKGQTISEPSASKKLLAKEYKERLRKRPIKPDFNRLEKRKNAILKLKLRLASRTKSKPWDMQNLGKALADLKTERSREPLGLMKYLRKM